MRTLVLAIALGVTACDSDVVGPGDLRRFGEAYARWNARSFPDYSYEIQTLCFCPPEITQWTRVTVRGGAVVEVEPVEPDPDFPISGSYWEPIDSLFSHIHQRVTEHDSYLDAVVVDYDAQLGYPTRIEYRYKANILDAGAIINIRKVLPLN